jgi:capsid protein
VPNFFRISVVQGASPLIHPAQPTRVSNERLRSLKAAYEAGVTQTKAARIPARYPIFIERANPERKEVKERIVEAGKSKSKRLSKAPIIIHH